MKGDISVICETELFGQRISQQRRREKQKQVSSDVLVKNLAELKANKKISKKTMEAYLNILEVKF